MQRFLRLAGFIRQAAGNCREQAKNFNKWDRQGSRQAGGGGNYRNNNNNNYSRDNNRIRVLDATKEQMVPQHSSRLPIEGYTHLWFAPHVDVETPRECRSAAGYLLTNDGQAGSS
ncbi:hypothetical protein Tco_0468047 [Tanacetum coccineum]